MNKEESIRALTLMLDSRYFEEKTELMFKLGLIHGTTHLANGQEASQAGLCMALEDGDWIVPTHRCHGFTICRGSDPYAMFSEMLGSSHGLAKGLGGSMHMPDRKHFNLGSSAVVGSGVPIATGIAFYNRRKNLRNISVAIFGDGASSRGSVHEAMNIASVWNLPVLFYCENNHYGMSAPADRMVSIKNIAERGKSYSIESSTVDGNDVSTVLGAVRNARSYILENSRPYLLEVNTYRQKGHSKSDRRVYRTAQEENSWLERDPITLFERKLVTENILSADEISTLHESRRQYIEECAQRAVADSSDRLTMTDVRNLVYAGGKS